MEDLKQVDAPTWVCDFYAQHITDVSSVRSHPQVFGNFEVVFAIDDLMLRIVRDRGQIFIDIKRHEHQVWTDLPSLIKHMGQNISTNHDMVVWAYKNRHLIALDGIDK